MQTTTLVIALFCFSLIAALPKIFFRDDGSYNFKWLVTASPYFFAGLACILSYMGHLPVFVAYDTQASLILQGLGAILFASSVGLMTMTLGTHRIPLALWHQDNDAPKSIVTWGAYKYIRHPFYTSFLMALLAAICIAPSIVTVVIFIFGFITKNVTAQREETRLSASEMGAEYVEFMKKTGRFFPKF